MTSEIKTTYMTTIRYRADSGRVPIVTVESNVKPHIGEGAVIIAEALNEEFETLIVPLTSIFDIKASISKEES